MVTGKLQDFLGRCLHQKPIWRVNDPMPEGGGIHAVKSDEISTLMRQIAEYRVRLQTYRWTRSVEPDDMLNSYVYANKKKMLAEQKKVLDALKRSIAKSVFVSRRMRKLQIPVYARFFGIRARVPPDSP